MTSIEDEDCRKFIEKCFLEKKSRPTAKELLEDEFLQITKKINSPIAVNVKNL